MLNKMDSVTVSICQFGKYNFIHQASQQSLNANFKKDSLVNSGNLVPLWFPNLLKSTLNIGKVPLLKLVTHIHTSNCFVLINYKDGIHQKHFSVKIRYHLQCQGSFGFGLPTLTHTVTLSNFTYHLSLLNHCNIVLVKALQFGTNITINKI